MSDSDEFSKESFFSMIEKAVKPQFFLLTTGFALFVDLVLVYFTGSGIKDAVAGGNSLNLSLGLKITLAFLGFSGVVSMLMPFAHLLSIQLYFETIYRAWNALEHAMDRAIGIDKLSTSPKGRENGCVDPWELRREAHDTGSEFLLGLYDEYRRRHQNEESNKKKIQFYAFCTLVFAALNYWLPGTSGYHTATRWIELYFSTSTPIWIALTMLFAMVYFPLHHNSWENQWIYCPPLHDKLEASDRERRRKAREIELEIERNAAAIRRAQKKQ